jgi:hypothetical protein
MKNGIGCSTHSGSVSGGDARRWSRSARLRKIQKSLAITRRFEEARDVKQHADAVQCQEAGVIGSVRAGFIALQRRELECFD